MDGFWPFWATKSEGVRLSVRAISFQDFQPMCPLLIHQRRGQTDRRATCYHNTALCTKVQRAVKTKPFLPRNATPPLHSINNIADEWRLSYSSQNKLSVARPWRRPSRRLRR